MKNGILSIRKLAAALGLAIFILAVMGGCEDPGPTGQTYIYDNHVEVIPKNEAPPMNDPLDDIWDDVPVTILTIARDTAEYENDIESMTLRLSSIRTSDRIYVRALWGYDATNSNKPQYSAFSRTFNYPHIDTLTTFEYAYADSHYYYPAVDDSILVRDYALIENTFDYFPVSSTGDTIFQNITLCTPVPDSVDTVVVATDAIWALYPAFTCSTWVDTLLYTSISENWTQKSAYNFVKTFYDSATVTIDGKDTTILLYTYKNTDAYDQDHIAIMWDMGNNGVEGANCMSMCHAEGMESTRGQRMYTTGGGTVDVWHWQSALSSPLYLAIDELWADSGHTADDGSSMIYESNWDDVNDRPIYMHLTDSAYHFPYLLSGETAPFNTALNFWPDGYTMPSFVLNEMATGSATDVSGFAWYTSLYTWYVLMSRSLSTGNGDDVNLSAIPKGDSVMTSVAVMDNVSPVHMYVTEPIYFIFK